MISQRLNSEEALIEEKYQQKEIQLVPKSRVNLIKDKNRRNLIRFKNVFESMSENDLDEFLASNFALINPVSYFKKSWDIFIFILILYSCLFTPYLICTFKSYLNYSELIIEVCLMIDILLRFFTKLKNENDIFINNHNVIILNYLTGSFLLDLFSLFPICFFNTLFSRTQHENIFSVKSEFSIYFWVKMLRILKIIQVEFVTETKFNKLFKLILIFYLLCHIETCFFIYIGNSKFDRINWISQYHFTSLNFIQLYITSLYFTVVTIITVGYGDILAVNILETSYNIFLLTFGVILYTFTVSTISSLISKEDERTVVFKEKLQLLEEIDQDFETPKELFKLIKNHLKAEVIENSFDKLVLLNSLPTNIKNQLTSRMYKDVIHNFLFFEKKNYNFILYVLPFLKKHFLNKSQALFSVGELVSEIYFPIENDLSITLEEKYDYLEIAQIKKYQHFGEALVVSNEISSYNLVSKQRNNQILCLKKQDFFIIKNNYNNEIQDILVKSYELMEIIDNKTEVFIKLFENCKNLLGVQALMKKINIYLMNQGFNKYFYDGKDFEDASIFIRNHEYRELLNLIDNSFSLKHTGMGVIKRLITQLETDDKKFVSKFNSPYKKVTDDLNIHKTDKLKRNSIIPNELKHMSPSRSPFNPNKFNFANFEDNRLAKSFNDLKNQNKIVTDNQITKYVARTILSHYEIPDSEKLRKIDFKESIGSLIPGVSGNNINISINNNNYYEYPMKLHEFSNSPQKGEDLKKFYKNLSVQNKILLRNLIREDSSNFNVIINEINLELKSKNNRKLIFQKKTQESFSITPNLIFEKKILLRPMKTLKSRELSDASTKILNNLIGRKNKISKNASSTIKCNNIKKNNVQEILRNKLSHKKIGNTQFLSRYSGFDQLSETERLDNIYKIIKKIQK